MEFREEYNDLFKKYGKGRLKNLKEIDKEIEELLDKFGVCGFDQGWLKWAFEYYFYLQEKEITQLPSKVQEDKKSLEDIIKERKCIRKED